MQRREEHARERVQWVVCLTAVAQVVERLPLLYRVVEAGEDDVRIELRVKASALEILQIGPADHEHVAVTLSENRDNTPASPFKAWTTDSIEALKADLQWAASQPCSEQAGELLSALVRIRGTMLRGNVYSP